MEEVYFVSIPYYRNVCLFEFVCSAAVFSEQAIHAFIDSFSCFNHCLYHWLVFFGLFFLSILQQRRVHLRSLLRLPCFRTSHTCINQLLLILCLCHCLLFFSHLSPLHTSTRAFVTSAGQRPYLTRCSFTT